MKNGLNLSDWVQVGTSVVVAVTAVASLFQSNPTLSWMLATVALAVVLFAGTKPVIKAIRQLWRNRLTGRFWPDLVFHESEFRQFVDTQRGYTLENKISGLLNNNQTDLRQFFPSDYLRRLFPLIQERHSFRPHRNEREFVRAVEEFESAVYLYSRDYVNGPLELLRSDTWRGKISARHEREIEEARERWVHFLETVERFGKQVRKEFGEDRFRSREPYYERPKRL